MSYAIRNECFMLIMEFAGVRQSITNCISRFIQCEDWMLTGPTSKRVPFNRPMSTNKTSRRFDFPNSSITASESSVIEIGEKFGGSRELRRRGWGVWSGVFPSPVAVGSGRGLCPLPRKFLRFLPENGTFWLHFFAIREIFSQFKGGGGMAQVAQW